MNRIKTKKAPKAIGAYSQGTKVGSLVFTSGQIAINPESGDLVVDNFEDELLQVLNNVEAVLKSAGSSKHSIVKLTVFLIDFSKFNIVNNIFIKFFKDDFPARSALEVSGLPLGVNVEIEAIGVIE